MYGALFLLGFKDSCLGFVSGHNNMCSIISPTTLLLSATGSLAFKNCGLSDEVSTFAAPEMLQDQASSTKPATDRVSASVLSHETSSSSQLSHACADL